MCTEQVHTFVVVMLDSTGQLTYVPACAKLTHGVRPPEFGSNEALT